MRRYAVMLATFLLLTATGPLFAQAEDTFARDAELVLKLAERSKALRDRMAQFAKDHKDSERITGDEHDVIDRAIREYGAIRLRLWDVVERVRTKTGMGKGHRPIMAWITSVVSWFKDDEELTAEKRDERIRALLVGVGAATVMIDNAASAIENIAGTIYEKRGDRPVNISSEEEIADVKLDMVINDLFHTVMKEYYSVSNHDAYNQVVGFLLEEQERIKELSGSEAEVKKLNALIFESVAGKQFLEAGGLLDDYKARLKAIGAKLAKRLEADMNALSKTFGNAMGSIHLGKATIKGKILKKIEKRMLEVLQPGDIIMDKTSFAMTDRLIPGHFGHVAIWLGRPDQLEELGLFDPAVNTYGDSLKNALEWKDKLMEGKCILEALRPGVVINTIEHFLYVDEVLILRLKPQAVGGEEELKKLRSRIVCRAMHHLGQRYDFNFDVNTANTIVCSELAYQAYPQNIAWPLTRTAGRWTISPDQVAVMAGPTDAFPLDIVYYVRSVWKDKKIVDQEYLEGLPIGGKDHYEFYWKTLLREFPMPDPAEFSGNEALTKWAEGVRELAVKFDIKQD